MNAALKPAIVITGASSGIGRELARVAAADGSFMLVIGRAQEPLAQLVGELSAGDAEAAALCIDLVEPQAGARIERALSERGLYCDVLVNSAGFGLYGPAAETDRDEQLKLIDLNARALTELSLCFLPGMVARGRGGILNVGSLTGYVPGPYMAAYYASKAYVRSFSAALSAEVAGSGVTVTCVAPGPVRTPFLDRLPARRTRLAKIMPRSNARETAAAGWRGFRAGKRLVIPRLMDRVIVGMLAVLPESLVLRLIATLQRP